MIAVVRPSGEFAVLWRNTDRHRFNKLIARCYALAVWQGVTTRSHMEAQGRQLTLMRGKVKADQVATLRSAIEWAEALELT